MTGDSAKRIMMGFDDLTFFDLEITIFNSQLDEVVLPLFNATDRNLTEWKKQIDAEFDEAISKAANEADEIDAKGEAAYRETTVDEQRDLIGAACLAFVSAALKDRLDGMGRYFKKSHPPDDREYVGRSWLQKRQDEYKKRFQIDFTKSPVTIDKIEELILARNAGLHWDGSALEEYRQKVEAPRFIKDGSFTVDHDKFLDAIASFRTDLMGHLIFFIFHRTAQTLKYCFAITSHCDRHNCILGSMSNQNWRE